MEVQKVVLRCFRNLLVTHSSEEDAKCSECSNTLDVVSDAETTKSKT